MLLEATELKMDTVLQTERTIYSLRHTAICMRIILSQGKVNIFSLVTNAGTTTRLSPVSFASAKRGTNKSGLPREDLSRPDQNSDTCLSARSTASGRSSRGFLVAAVSRVRWRAMLIIFLSFPASVCRAVLLMPAFATAFACRRPPTLTPAMAERAAEYFKPRIIGPRVQATNAR